MKNLFSTVALVVVLLLLGSCATTQQGIRGFYAPTNVVTTDLEYEKVWSKVIDFFAPLQKGYKMGLLGGAGVGKTVLIKELINNNMNSLLQKQIFSILFYLFHCLLLLKLL